MEDLQEVVEVAEAVGAGDPRGTLCSQALGERKQRFDLGDAHLTSSYSSYS